MLGTRDGSGTPRSVCRQEKAWLPWKQNKATQRRKALKKGAGDRGKKGGVLYGEREREREWRARRQSENTLDSRERVKVRDIWGVGMKW